MKNLSTFKLLFSLPIVALMISGCTTKQILVVSPTKTSVTELSLYEDGKKVEEFTVNVGRSGIAKLGEKREGDGKTPSGEFPLTALFAYEPAEVKMPFIHATKEIHCVDDQKSKYYNQIIDTAETTKDYDSFEYMRRDDIRYTFGAVVDYNAEHTPGNGSCIFIHVQKEPKDPTSGCISMDENDMKWLFYRLDRDSDPTVFISDSEESYQNYLLQNSLK